MKKMIQRTVLVSSLVLGATSVALACDGKKKESTSTNEVQMRAQASTDESSGTTSFQGTTETVREKKGFKSLILTRDRIGVKGEGD